MKRDCKERQKDWAEYVSSLMSCLASERLFFKTGEARI